MIDVSQLAFSKPKAKRKRSRVNEDDMLMFLSDEETMTALGNAIDNHIHMSRMLETWTAHWLLHHEEESECIWCENMGVDRSEDALRVVWSLYRAVLAATELFPAD